jgi:4-hydroxybenzoate polyprenyltransferase
MAALLCLWLPGNFVLVLCFYLLLSTYYSLYLKTKVLVDVMVLGGLYTLRIIAGGAAVNVEVSKWLLAFSIFLFVSLAFAKRYTELLAVEQKGLTRTKGRAYRVEDLRIIEGVGPASGYLAVMVLALYINDASSARGQLYPTPFFLWVLCPLLMYWITRVWFFAGRNILHDDPIVFAIKDRVSWMTLAVAAVLVGLASVGWVELMNARR